MPLTRFDDKLTKGQEATFTYKGYAVKGGTTKAFEVHNSYDHTLLGIVRFKAQWRQYVFFPLNCLLKKECLREIADFCEEQTAAWRYKREAFPAVVQEQEVQSVT